MKHDERGRYPCNTAARISKSFASFTTRILIATSLLIPSLFDWSGNRSWGGIKLVGAAPCNATETGVIARLTVSWSNEYNLPTVFDCENGEFEVTWSGSVTVNDSIRVGQRTTVVIVGDYDNGLLSNECMYDEPAGNSSSVDESMGAVVGGAQIIAGTDVGPIFVVENASLHLQNVALRNGKANNASFTGNSGGGVHATDANVTLVGCEFDDMFAADRGGGVYALRSTLVVYDTVFRNCNTTQEDEDDEDSEEYDMEGGAIWVSYSCCRVTLHDVTPFKTQHAPSLLPASR